MTNRVEQIAANVRHLVDEVDNECSHLRRSIDEVTLVAVTKTFGPDVISAAAQTGLTDFGENRIQESKHKIPDVRAPGPIRWHLIGHLQSNKAKDAIAMFDLIQSVDHLDLIQILNRRAELADKHQDVLIQVNTTDEPQKSGCTPEGLDDLVRAVARMPFLRLRGLMTIGPFVEERAPIERAFKLLRREFERLGQENLGDGEMRYCSMGMTDDWRIALAEGSNMLRIGRAIFGERG